MIRAGDRVTNTVTAIVAIVVAVFFAARWYGELRASEHDPLLVGCKSNLVDFHNSLDAYQREHDGRYPPRLQDADNLPRKCPAAAATETYAYLVSTDRRSYTLMCGGSHHANAGLPTDSPRIGTNFR